MKKLTLFVAALCATTMAVNAKTVVLNVDSCKSTEIVSASQYKAYSNDYWSASIGGNSKSFGFNAKNMKQIDNAYGTAATKSNHGVTVVGKKAIANVNRITLSYSASSEIGTFYIGYSTDGNTWSAVQIPASGEVPAQAASVAITKNAMNVQLDFVAIPSAYYAFVFDAGKTYSSNTAFRIDDVVIYLQNVTEVAVAVEAPTFSVAGGKYVEPQNVSLACETEGASIYYTTDGAEPSEKSTLFVAGTPIVVNETATVKAIAIKGEDKSDVVTATYTFPESVENLAAFITKADEDNFCRVASECVVTYRLDEKNVYLQDATAGILIYDKNGSLAEYTIGQRLTGIVGTYGTYSGSTQFIPTYLPAAVDGEAVSAKSVSISEVTKSIESQFVKLTNVSFSEDVTFKKGTITATSTLTGTNLTVSDGSDDLIIYNKLKVLDGDYSAAKKYDIEGIVVNYSGKSGEYVEFAPISVKENSSTALENVEALEVYAENGRIYAAEGARIFTVSGIDVTEMNGQLNGIYIVKVGNQATKIAVK